MDLKIQKSSSEGTGDKTTTDDSVKDPIEKCWSGDCYSIYRMRFGECVTKTFSINSM